MSTGQSPSKGYINSPPGVQPGMSTTATPTERRLNNSENSSLTAVDDDGNNNNNGQVIPGLSLASSPSNTGTNPKNSKTRYEQWYPGDASHNGRPAWWNKWFCCGYGLGCLLCPCSSWNCKHERS
ncbi:hypothetical protein I204_03954 [Kwoniella mangroviensis CBS 8886]|nr:hypothetical protein I204_03954 [Kwoniella mangroviensis CBS 8886]